MKLEVRNLALSVAGKRLVSDLSFIARAGRVLAITGPSGCGKSSILDFLCGTLPGSFQGSGTIMLNDRDITSRPSHERGIGLQLQDHLLFPHLSVSENLAFGIPSFYSRSERKQKIEKALSECQLPNFGRNNPLTLSGGQRARISLMRTLLSEPKVLLLDEPFSKLDPELRQQFREFVFNRVSELSIPVIMVTHDQADIPEASETIKL
ncbi:ATP-binding cassette domain-containing protein [Endozoicomonas numazuensis]|uniref:ABC transporter ATP-binding protein n=1 Tax=Endozoicomonas numazuensis TaxID=1137799 RepID=A0A081N020_9GAMM|nr:ATP-binding cassette domain-containing protein [Endozoicomonas numazuensis]KEQ11793.1 ABC transporter ATP-binding protein [Endozoicomonas numazuensis]